MLFFGNSILDGGEELLGGAGEWYLGPCSYIPSLLPFPSA